MSLNYWNLITKYLTGEISPEENDELLQWIDEKSANKELLKKAESLWELSGKYNFDFKPDTNRDWEELKAKIIAESAVTKFSVSEKTTFWWLKIAAAALLLIGIGYLVKTALKTDEKTMLSGKVAYIDVETTDSINVFYLPDDTKIWLNKNSRFTYPAKFVDKERVVTLNGEAFFEVVDDTTQPFIVYAGNTQTKVVGTSFNVRAYEDEEEIEVDVVEGKVEFSVKEDKEGKKLILETGDKGTFDKKSSSVKKRKNKDKKNKWWLKDIEKDIKRFIKKIGKKLKNNNK